MKRDCPNILSGCAGVDSPITNTSAESPDPLLWSGVGWQPYNPYRPPPLGGGPVTGPVDCSNITWSDVSQTVADFLAQINATTCAAPTIPAGAVWPGIPPWPTFPPFPPFPALPDLTQPTFVWHPPSWDQQAGPDLQQFTNDPQTASAVCPNGATFTLTIPAGTVISGPIDPAMGQVWIQIANAAVQAMALQQVYALRACIDVPYMAQRTPPGTTPPPVIPPPPGSPPGTPGTSSRGPSLAANPGYACLGKALIPDLNKYTVSGTGDFIFSIISGMLPPGITLVKLSARTAELQGITTSPGKYDYAIMAMRQGMTGIQVQVADTMYVFGLVNSTIDSISVGAPYSYQLTTDGGTDPVSFVDVSVLPDGLPVGLTMSPSGLISGTPTSLGTGKFQVQITDDDGGQCTQTVTIGEISPTLNWNTLVWDTVSLNVDPNALGSGSASGNHFTFDLQGSNQPSAQGNAVLQLHASLTYNGPAQHCTLTMNVTQLGVGNATTWAGDIAIGILQDGTLIAFASNNTLVAGVNVIPFDIADTGGNPSLIEINGLVSDGYIINATGGSIFPNGAHVAASGILS